ncbi:MAG TPA: ATPase, T2SS/T4P/T4SS family [Ilumatobacteraceae bacterium]|nr:ATPase, T2SS/T4P/T4SS family [Ilumatobacteraceae bacterium]
MIDVVAERSPLGGLERWLDDPLINEIVVNGNGDIWIERSGSLARVATMSTDALVTAIEHILRPIGRRLDRSNPTVDARLPDGSRVCAVIEPISVDGPCLAIRRFPMRSLPLTAFTSTGVVELLQRVVDSRCNVLISGPTSSGKTTLLNSLAGRISSNERIITLEDVAELRLAHPHVVRLESRLPTAEGAGEVTLQHLLRTALRMRPDRLVLGEVRGAEAVPLVQAMNTGHDGSMATVHANSAADALARVASLVVQEVPGWPLGAVSEQVHRSIDVVIHLGRASDQRRRVAEICETSATGTVELRCLADLGGVRAALRKGRS